MAGEYAVAARGLEALRAAVASLLSPQPALAVAIAPDGTRRTVPVAADHWLLATDADVDAVGTGDPGSRHHGQPDDSRLAASSEESAEERERLIALVELARKGDAEAFGMLFDHYQPAVYRFLYYRTRSTVVAEDLTSEAFLRALRNMSGFRWQGKDFGAWLMTIARNLATDHFKAGRTRLELTTEDMSAHDDTTEGPEDAVLQSITNEILLDAMTRLPNEQRECLVMRFLQGMSISETAASLGRSDGAIKQLQLRGVRNLAKLMPEGLR